MTLLAGPGSELAARQWPAWGGALLVALLAHALVVSAWLWHPQRNVPVLPAAAPLVVEVTMMAAPETPDSALPPGPQQVEAAPSEPEPVVEPEPEPEPPVPLPKMKAEVVLRERPEPSVKKPIPKPQKRETQPEKVVASEPSSDQAAPRTTAPVSVPTAQPGNVTAAPSLGVPSQREIDVRQRWQSLLQAHLDQRKRYPRQARMRQQQGVPWVSFTMDRQGKVLSAALFRASGVTSLDTEVVALVHRAEPLPPPPPEVKGEQISLTVPVEFFMGR